MVVSWPSSRSRLQVDPYEQNDMMESRFRFFYFPCTLSKHQKREMPPRARCFARWLVRPCAAGMPPTAHSASHKRDPAYGAPCRGGASDIGRGGCPRLDGDPWRRGTRRWSLCQPILLGRLGSLVDAVLAHLRPAFAVLAQARGKSRRGGCLPGCRRRQFRVSAMPPSHAALMTIVNLSEFLTARMDCAKRKLAKP